MFVHWTGQWAQRQECVLAAELALCSAQLPLPLFVLLAAMASSQAMQPSHSREQPSHSRVMAICAVRVRAAVLLQCAELRVRICTVALSRGCLRAGAERCSVLKGRRDLSMRPVAAASALEGAGWR